MLVKKLLLGALVLLYRPAAAQYVRPDWFDRIEAEDQTGLLKRCFKRQDVPPEQGRRCARRPKLCYFGTQECAGVGPHPETRCFCDGQEGSRTWNCQNATCPTTILEEDVSPDPPSITDVCPPDAPPGLNVGCVDDLVCTYAASITLPDGSPCTETTTCSCSSSAPFLCQIELACVSPDPPTFPGPGEGEVSLDPPSITDVCPPDAPPGLNVGCVDDLICTYAASTTLPDGSPCTETTTCSCTSSAPFLCQIELACVSPDPPVFVEPPSIELVLACPSDTPPGPNFACGADLECKYEDAFELPDGTPCMEVTTCSCTSPGAFLCEITLDCAFLTPDPPSIADVCPPDAPPGPNVGCVADLVCPYETETTLEDGSPCTQSSTCTCTSPGDFICEVGFLSCVSANPPVFVEPPSIELVLACPSDTPPGPNFACGADLECKYEDAFELPDGTPCMEITTCSCTSPGAFLCEITLDCAFLTPDPPSIADVCPPDAPPGPNVGCVADLVCPYETETTLEDGTPCTQSSTCICTSPGDFICEAGTISCVSANPPSFP